MSLFIRIASKSELPPPGQVREFAAGDRMVCVANVDGRITAIDNVCLHRGGQLGQGVVLDGKVICPWHGWGWDPQTGACAHDPNCRLPVYGLRIEGDDVLVDVSGEP